ncbi:hypothetical protein F5890DRAFT_569201 [Lentinula detonsa]|uniref:Uncharacterized protein n=1 Tax=Lentinula detonsa TaxID=2804962 RepID=A0AA38PU36_9AGAR|nr:hypothetical protein F5890DRAFT_569201 [Lentinula detonsa]
MFRRPCRLTARLSLPQPSLAFAYQLSTQSSYGGLAWLETSVRLASYNTRIGMWGILREVDMGKARLSLSIHASVSTSNQRVISQLRLQKLCGPVYTR